MTIGRKWPWIAALIGSAAALGGLLLLGQGSFEPAHFDFGDYRRHTGTLEFLPYPALYENGRWTMLVGSGKWGAEKAGPKLGGAVVNFRAARIYSRSEEMLEVDEASWSRVDKAPASLPERIVREQISLWGEIADSKCFLGVMNPGAGRVHRECAVRCLSGGVPPIFVARDREGGTRIFWLAAAGGERLPRSWLLRNAGVPQRLSGQLVRRANLEYFEVGPLPE